MEMDDMFSQESIEGNNFNNTLATLPVCGKKRKLNEDERLKRW